MSRSMLVRAALLATLSFVGVSAASAQSRVAVVQFSGPSAGVARDKVVSALSAQSGVTVVSTSEVEKAATKAGVEVSNYTAVAAQANINAFIEGKVTKRGRRLSLTLTVKDGANGESVGEGTIAGPNPRVFGKNVRSQTWKKIGDAIGNAKAPDLGGGDSAGSEETPIVADEEPSVPAGSAGRVVLRKFDGAGGDGARSAAQSALESKGYEVIGPEDADSAADSAGADLGSSEGRVAVARKLSAQAFIEGRVQRAGRRLFKVQVAVYNGADGERAGQASFSGRTVGAANGSVKQRFWAELGSALSGTSVPTAGRTATAAHHEDEESATPKHEDEEEEDSDTGARPSALTVAAKFDLFWRSFGYKDDLNDSLLKYNLGPAPYVHIEAEWYPLAHFMGGIPADFGLEGRFGMSFGLKSEFLSGGNTYEYDTSALDWLIGARFRLPFDRDELSLGVGYGAQNFTIDANDSAAVIRPNIPDVNYSFLRFSLAGRYWLGPISLRGRAGFLLVLNAGDSGEGIASSDRGTAGTTGGWFPNLSANGLEAGAEVGYELFSGFEARLGFDLRYYFYSLNPEPGDPFIAGGASDLYPTVTLGVSYTLPGSGGGEGAGDGAAASEDGPKHGGGLPDESSDY